MSLPRTSRALAERFPNAVPRSDAVLPRWVRLAAVPAVVLVVSAGVWLTGAVLTQDAVVAKLLTASWLAVAGAAALAAGWRWRGLAVAVVPAYALTAVALGGYLFYASTVDRVVGEQVLTAGSSATGVRTVADGEFRGISHPTAGTATVLERRDGSRVLTLTRFETDPGPDLRVYLVPRPDADPNGAVDLGALKGNRGDQQYDLPAGARAGAVVIWCRAFSVAFGVAELT